MAQSSNGAKSLSELYPELSAEELKVASYNLDRYLGLILRIVNRRNGDSKTTPSGSASDQTVEKKHGM